MARVGLEHSERDGKLIQCPGASIRGQKSHEGDLRHTT